MGITTERLLLIGEICMPSERELEEMREQIHQLPTQVNEKEWIIDLENDSTPLIDLLRGIH